MIGKANFKKSRILATDALSAIKAFKGSGVTDVAVVSKVFSDLILNFEL